MKLLRWFILIISLTLMAVVWFCTDNCFAGGYLPYDGESEVHRVLALGSEIMQVRNVPSGKYDKTYSPRKVPGEICVSNVVYNVKATSHEPEYGVNLICGCLFTIEVVRNDNSEVVAEGFMMSAKDAQTAREMAFGLDAQHSSMSACMIANALDIEAGDEIVAFGFSAMEDMPSRITLVYRNAIISLWGNGDIKAVSANLMKACCPQSDFNSVKPLPLPKGKSIDKHSIHPSDSGSMQIYDMGCKKMISCGVIPGGAIPCCRDGLEVPDKVSFGGIVYNVAKHTDKTYGGQYGFVGNQTRIKLTSDSTNIVIAGIISFAKDVPTARALSLGLAAFNSSPLNGAVAKKFSAECEGEIMMFANKSFSETYWDQVLVYRNMIISLRSRYGVELKALAAQLVRDMSINEAESNREHSPM